MKPVDHPMPDLLTEEETARVLRIPPHTLQAARSNKRRDYPPFIRVGRHVRYSRQALAAWLEGQQAQTGDAR